MVAVLLGFCKDPRNDGIALQHVFSISFVLHAFFFSSNKRLKDIFFKTTPTPPSQELNGWPLRPWQTRTHCCGYIVADTNVSLYALTRNIYRGHKFCARDTKIVFDFVQKHSVSATNVSQFAQLGNTTFILCPARLRTQEIS